MRNTRNNYEIVVVDNASKDGSLQLLREIVPKKQLIIIANSENKSFSAGCNQGVERANGTHFVFMNNDIQVFRNWDAHMLDMFNVHEDCGMVGAKLMYPKSKFNNSYTLQHAGIAFREDFANKFIRPYNLMCGENILTVPGEIKSISVTAALSIVERGMFLKIEGFNEDYFYGYEDVDLGLKIFEKGYYSYCPKQPLAFHYEFGTQSKDKSKSVSSRRLNNQNIFKGLWQSKLLGWYLDDTLKEVIIPNGLSDDFLLDDEGLSITIKLPAPIKQMHLWGDYYFAKSLQKYLYKTGTRAVIQGLEQWQENNESKANLILRGLSEFKCPQNKINIIWHISHPDAVQSSEYINYDYCFIASSLASEKLNANEILREKMSSLLQATDHDIFHNSKSIDLDKYSRDVLFVGNSRGIYRKAVKYAIEGDFELSLYGSNWKNLIDECYIRGNYIENDQLWKYYSSAKVVLNDHWDDMAEKGFVSNRIYDALSCEAIVLSDRVKGMDPIIEKYITIYEDQDDFNIKLKDILQNQKFYRNKALGARKYIIDNYSFKVRAQQVTSVLKKIQNEKKVQ